MGDTFEHTENYKDASAPKVRRRYFLHTFGYDKFPDPDTRPQNNFRRNKKHLKNITEKYEFDYVNYFVPDSENLWVDEIDDYDILTNKITMEIKAAPPPLKPVSLKNPLMAPLKPGDVVYRYTPLPTVSNQEYLKAAGFHKISETQEDEGSDFIESLIEDAFSVQSVSKSLHAEDIPFNDLKQFKPINFINWEHELQPGVVPEMTKNDVFKAGWIPSTGRMTWLEYVNGELADSKNSMEEVLLYLNIANSLRLITDARNMDAVKKDWFNLFISGIDNLGNDLPFFSSYMARHLFNTQTPEYLAKNGATLNIQNLMNISNDAYYAERTRTDDDDLEGNYLNIVHSLSAEDLQRTLFPIYLDCMAARHWQRPVFMPMSYGPLSKPGFHEVKNLRHHIRNKAKEISKKQKQLGLPDTAFVQSLDDITSTDGHLIMLEFCEEMPPIMCKNGMNSMILEFTAGALSGRSSELRLLSGQPIVPIPLDPQKKKLLSTSKPSGYYYGKSVQIRKQSPFLVDLSPVDVILALENNLYRCPLYQHEVLSSDFLIVRNSGGYFIREVQAMFLCGQMIPKKQVPTPGSKNSTKFLRDLLQANIYRIFTRSKDIPPTLKTEEIRKQFKMNSDNAIRKRLKTCSDYKRNNNQGPGDTGCWVLRSNFVLPSIEDIRKLCRAEDACLYYSMIANERRLKDLNYTRKMYSVSEMFENMDEELYCNDEELLVASWNTTRVYIEATRGKCIMNVLGGCADPTGCGKGFSYTKYESTDERVDNMSFKPANFDDYDLKKINIKLAKKFLVSCGSEYKTVEGMSRWEVISTLKQLSNEGRMPKNLMSRLIKVIKSITPQEVQLYKSHCQRLFKLQNAELASRDIPDQIDEEKMVADSENWGKQLESFLDNIQIYDASDDDNYPNSDDQAESTEDGSVRKRLKSQNPKKLLIKRTFHENNKIYHRTEIVTNPKVIHIYRKTIQTNKVLQHKIKVITKNHPEGCSFGLYLREIALNTDKRNISNVDSRKKIDQQHLKREQSVNKMDEFIPFKKLIKTERKKNSDSVKIEGTKMYIGKSLIESSKDKARSSNIIKFGKQQGKKRSRSESFECDYQPIRVQSRRRTDPLVTLNAIFENICVILKDVNMSWAFHQAVQQKLVPDYYNIVKNPMDLATLREMTKKHSFTKRESFMESVNLILQNCILYNGKGHSLTDVAQNIVNKCKSCLEEKDEEIYVLEKEINPMLDEDSQVALSWIFESVISKAKSNTKYWPFAQPVNLKLFPNYLNFVTEPMDMERIRKRSMEHKYSSMKSFLQDIQLLYENSMKFNGLNHSVTKLAEELVGIVKSGLDENKEIISKLENDIGNQPEMLTKFYEQKRKLKLKRSNSKTLDDDSDVMVDSEHEDYRLLKDLEISDDK